MKKGSSKALLALAAVVSLSQVPVSAAVPKEADERIVVQLNVPDSKAIGMSLMNVTNIIAASLADGHNPAISVVVFGKALSSFTTKPGSEFAAAIKTLSAGGHVRFVACHKSMQKFGYGPQDILPEFSVVPSGAYEIIKLQKQGYLYFRP